MKELTLEQRRKNFEKLCLLGAEYTAKKLDNEHLELTLEQRRENFKKVCDIGAAKRAEQLANKA